MDDRPPINNEHLVTERFGHWPSFHDAEVTWFQLDRSGPTAEFVVHAFEMTDKIDDRGYFILEKHCLVRFRCDRLESTTLGGFNQQNALFGIDFKRISENGQAEDQCDVTLEASCGLDGVVRCGAVSVVSVVPCSAEGEPVAA